MKMLVDPKILMSRDCERLKVGIYKISHFSADLLLWGKNDFDRTFFEVNEELDSNGVVDSPEQFISDFGAIVQNHPKPLTVFMTHIEKEPSNYGRGGGWRWHKWGAYLGHGKPTMEYLDDEAEFSGGVWVFEIVLVDNLPLL